MDAQRRSVLKASGIAALLGSTGLAGCSGLLGGNDGSGPSGPTPEDWQYDPAVLLDTQNKFFGSMDYATIYRNRQYLSDQAKENIESPSGVEDSPIKPKDIDLVTGVGGLEVSTQQSSGEGFGSIAILGSFQKSTVVNYADSQSGSETEKIGSYQGYTLYRDTSNSTGTSAEGEGVVGVNDGAIVVGFAGAAQTAATVSARDATETAIDASMGNAATLRGNDQYAKQVTQKLGDSTIRFGMRADPQLVAQATQQAGPSSARYVEGMRAGGFGASVNGKTTEFVATLVYNNAQTAEDTGIAPLINGLSTRVTEESPAINSLEASRDGAAITVTMVGDTKKLAEQASQGSGGMTT